MEFYPPITHRDGSGHGKALVSRGRLVDVRAIMNRPSGLSAAVIGLVTCLVGRDILSETFEVTRLEDSGLATLRWAIEQANARPGEDRVDISPSGQLRLEGALPPIADALEIVGPGRDLLEVSGERKGRVFRVLEGVPCRISNLTVSNGRVAGGEDGGGIHNAGTLSLSNCVVVANRVSVGFGGGVFNAGRLTVARSRFQGNEAVGEKGGEAGGGGAGGGGGGFGGAIHSESGEVTLSDTEFVGNSALGGDGGSGARTASVRGGDGGGITGGRGSVDSAPGTAGGFGGGGGGGGQLVSASGPAIAEGAAGGFGGGGGGGGTPYFLGFVSGGPSPFGGGRGGAGGATTKMASGGGGGGGAGLGGALFVRDGRVTVRRCRFEENHAVGGHGGETLLPGSGGDGYGGGIFVDAGFLEIEDTTFLGNRAMGGQDGIGGSGAGGGLFSRTGTNVVRRSTFQWNFAGGGGSTEANLFAGGTARGGAMMVAAGELRASNCTLSENSALGGSAGVYYFFGTGGQAYGGALAVSGGRVELLHTTIFRNNVTGGSQGGGDVVQMTPERIAEALGGGFHVASGTLSLKNSILAGNTVDLFGLRAEGFGPVVSGGGNHVEVAVGIVGLSATDRTGTPDRLGSLAMNGGWTATHALLDTSPARDAVPTDPDVGEDQRGVVRPQGARADAGAFEAVPVSEDKLEIQIDGRAVVAGSPTRVASGAELSFVSTFPQATILYTLDGTVPTTESELYRFPLALASNVTVRAIAFRRDFGASLLTGPLEIRTDVERRFTLNTSVIGSGAVGIEPAEGPYSLGQEVRIHARRGYGWRFVGWSGDGTGSDSPLRLRMDRDRRVTAEFELIRPFRLVTETIGPGRLVLYPPGGVYESNTVVRVEAVGDPIPGELGPNWPIAWSGDITNYMPTARVTMNRDLRISVRFQETRRSPAFVQLQVWTSGMGQVFEPMRYRGTPQYPSSLRVPLNAVAEEGWKFLRWTGDTSGTNANHTFQIQGDSVVNAVFGTTLSAVAAGQGTIDLGPGGSGTVGWEPKRVTAVPATGHYFVRWGGAGSGTRNPLDVLVREAEPMVSALFAPLPVGEVALVTPVDGRGLVEVSPPGNRQKVGQTVTLRAHPEPGQSFVQWIGHPFAHSNPIEVRMDASKTIRAVFTDGPLLAIRDPFRFRRDGYYRLRLEGEAGRTFRIERSSDLVAWAREADVTLRTRSDEIPVASAGTANRVFFRALTIGP